MGICNACYEVSISGEVTFSEMTKNTAINWQFGEIRRKYPIYVVDDQNRPVSGAVLDFIVDNAAIKSLVTNEQGKVEFGRLFTKDNHRKSVEVHIAGKEEKQTIGFFTDTPIVYQY